MADYIGPNSRRFTKQGNRLTSLALTDKLFFTIEGLEETVDPKNPLKYGTRLGDFTNVKQYIVGKLSTEGLGTIIETTPDGGLTGTGYEDDPIRLDEEWLLDNYLPTSYMPISQIGNSTDFTLPISGSYFSVTYPFNSNRRLQHSCFMERNGELRVLSHKTNGEQLRVTYSFWPNTHSASAITNTDIVYTPPGLADGEFIGGVFTASANAMIGEIWDATGFREWVFITLNGTFNHEFHTLLRLGRGLDVVFSGVAGDALQTSRFHNVCAVISKGKKYIVVGVSQAESGFYGAAKIYSVDDTNGTLTQTFGWRTINSAGGVYEQDGLVAMYEEFATDQLTSKTACMLITDDRLGISSVATGAPNQYFLTLGPSDTDDRVSMMLQWYAVGTSAFLGSISLRSSQTVLIDFDKRTVSARDLSAKDQRWKVGLSSNGRALSVENRVYGGNYFVSAHYYATSSWVQMLPYGVKVVLNASLDIAAKPSIERFLNGVNNDRLDSMYPDKWSTSASLQRWLDLQPPTPIYSGYIGRAIYDKLFQINQTPSPFLNLGPNTIGKYGLLLGNKTDHTYNILDSTTLDGQFTAYKGFRLNASRENVILPLWSSINSFVNGSAYGYHNAVFGEEHPTDEYLTHQAAIIKTDMTIGDTCWGWRASLKQKMDTFVANLPNPVVGSDATKLYNSMYSIVPPFPGISPDMALVTIVQSFIDPANTNPDTSNTAGSPIVKYIGLCPCTYTKAANGNLMLTNVDLSTLPSTPIFRSGSAIVIGYGSGRIYTSTAWRINQSTIDIIANSGNAMQNLAGNNSNGPTSQCIIRCDRGTGIVERSLRPATLSIPSYSPKVGFGVVSNSFGLAAFYGFTALNDDLLFDTDNITILGTARPPAGFAFTISAPIRIATNGSIYELPIGVYDLAELFPDPKLKTFYMTAKIIGEDVSLAITDTPPIQDTATSFYMGFIITTESEIKEINAKPIVRWEFYRPSVTPIGSGIPVSVGLPHNAEDTEWPPAKYQEYTLDKNYPEQYTTSPVEGSYMKQGVDLFTFVDERQTEPFEDGMLVTVIVDTDVAIIGGLDPLL